MWINPPQKIVPANALFPPVFCDHSICLNVAASPNACQPEVCSFLQKLFVITDVGFFFLCVNLPRVSFVADFTQTEKTNNQVIYQSSLLQPVFTFLVRRRPRVAAVIITAANELVRKSSKRQKRAHREEDKDEWLGLTRTGLWFRRWLFVSRVKPEVNRVIWPFLK